VLLFDLGTCEVCRQSDYFINSDKGPVSRDQFFSVIPNMVLNTKMNELTWTRPFMIFNHRRSIEVVFLSGFRFFLLFVTGQCSPCQ